MIAKPAALALIALLALSLYAAPALRAVENEDPNFGPLKNRDVTEIPVDKFAGVFDFTTLEPDVMVKLLEDIKGILDGGKQVPENLTKRLLAQRALWLLAMDKALGKGKTTAEVVSGEFGDHDFDMLDDIIKKPVGKADATKADACRAILAGYDELISGLSQMGIIMTIMAGTDGKVATYKDGDREGIDKDEAEKNAKEPLEKRLPKIVVSLLKVAK